VADERRSAVLERTTAAEGGCEAKAEAQGVQSATAPVRRARWTRRKSGWTEFIVDVWITNFHWVKFGLYRHSRSQAKSRQFTSDMDICAEVTEHGERTRLLGYREDLWRKHAGMDSRLVLKLFNETLNWRASMDLMIGRSLQLTLGARGLPVTAFSINAGEHDDVVYLERSANKWPLAPEHFSFFLLDDGRPQFYRLKRDVIDLGGDYTLFSHRNDGSGPTRRQGVHARRQMARTRASGPRQPAPSGHTATVLRHADLQRQLPSARASDRQRRPRRPLRAQDREAGGRPLHEPAARQVGEPRGCFGFPPLEWR
jgi:hypothetical protein